MYNIFFLTEISFVTFLGILYGFLWDSHLIRKAPFFDIIKCWPWGIQEIIKFYYFGNSLLTAHSNTIYTLAVNTTGGTPEEKASRHVTLVGTTNVFSLWIIENSIVLHYFNTYFNTRPIKQMFTEVNFIFLNVKLNVKYSYE
jgi:hypothetical protein